MDDEVPLTPTASGITYWLDEVLRRNGPCPTCGSLGMVGVLEDRAKEQPTSPASEPGSS